jgi:hypothetical protein
MPGLIKVIAWSLAGAILGGASMYFGLLAYDRLFEASTDNTVRGFQTGQEILTGIGGAVVGLALGAIVGVIRIRFGNPSHPPNASDQR